MTKTKDETEVKTSAPETFLDQLHREHYELGERLVEITSLIGSAGFADIDHDERERLKGQEIAMGHYHGILAVRLAYHKAKGTK